MRSVAPTPLLSIIVPIHNVAPYLWDCLASLAAQRVTDFEAILVDDASTDCSGTIAQRFVDTDSRFSLLRHATLQGTATARNHGAAAASGRFIAFADADDVVLVDGYFHMIAALQASGSSYATGGVERIFGQKRQPSPLHSGLHEVEQRGIDLRAAPRLLRDTTCWNKVFRRDFYDAVVAPWPEDMTYEDIIPMARAMTRARGIDVCCHTVYLWRQREDGTSLTQNRNNMLSLKDRFRAIDEVIAEIAANAPDLRDLAIWKTLAVDLKVFLRIYGKGSAEWRADLMRRCARVLTGLSDIHLAELHPAWAALYTLIAQGKDAEVEAILLNDRLVEQQFLLRATPDGVRAEWPEVVGHGLWVQGAWDPVPNWLPDPQPVLTATTLRAEVGLAGLMLSGTVSVGPASLRRSPAPKLELQVCAAGGQRVMTCGLSANHSALGMGKHAFTARLVVPVLQDLARIQKEPFTLHLASVFGDESAQIQLRADRSAAAAQSDGATALRVADRLAVTVAADVEGYLTLSFKRLPEDIGAFKSLAFRLRRKLVRAVSKQKAAPPQPARHHVSLGFAETGFLLGFDPPLPAGAGGAHAEIHLVMQDRPGIALAFAATPAGGLWLDLRHLPWQTGSARPLPPGRYDLFDRKGAPILVKRMIGPKVIWLQDMCHEITQTRGRLQLVVRSHVSGHALPALVQQARQAILPQPEKGAPVVLFESLEGRRIGGRPLDVLRALQASQTGFRAIFIQAHAAAPCHPDMPPGVARVRRHSAQYWQVLQQAVALVTDSVLPPGAHACKGLCVLQTGTGFEERPEDLPLHEVAIWAGLMAPAGDFAARMATQTGFCGQHFPQEPAWSASATEPEPSEPGKARRVLILLHDRASLGKALAQQAPKDGVVFDLVAIGGNFLAKAPFAFRPVLQDRSDDPDFSGLLAAADVIVSDIAPLCAAMKAKGRDVLRLAPAQGGHASEGMVVPHELSSAINALLAAKQGHPRPANSMISVPLATEEVAAWLWQRVDKGPD